MIIPSLLATFVGNSLFAVDVWTPATLPPGYDSSSSGVGNRGTYVRQKLPVGDKMTATFTTTNNVLIVNADLSVPTFEGTVGPFTSGISFFIPGTMNGKKITDIHQKHSTQGISESTMQIAAFTGVTGSMESVPVGNWLEQNGYNGTDETGFSLRVPDFNNTSQLYYGVDLSIWNANKFSVDSSMFGTSYNIVNGTSVLLPGFLFSTTPLTYSNNGWETSSPFTGAAILDSYHEMSVPEPSTYVSAIVGTCFLVCLCYQKQKKKGGITAL